MMMKRRRRRRMRRRRMMTVDWTAAAHWPSLSFTRYL